MLPLVALVWIATTGEASAWSHLTSTVLPGYFVNSIMLAAGVALGAMAIGVPAAWWVTHHEFRGRRVAEVLLVLPLAIPAYVSAYAYTDFLQTSGPLQGSLRSITGWQVGHYWFPDIRSLGGAIVVMSLALYPYVYLLARAAFLQQSPSLAETARMLGVARWRMWLSVHLPMARPAIAAGAALVVMETLADFGTVAYFAVPTFTTGIFRAWQSMGDLVSAARLALCLLAIVGVILALERASRKRARFSVTRGGRPPVRRSVGSAGAALLVLCVIPTLLGFALPAFLLIRLALDASAELSIARVAGWAFNSIAVAALVAMLATALALLLGYAARTIPRPEVRWVKQMGALGYGLPGAVLAIGVLIVATHADKWPWMQSVTLTGSLALLVYAGVVRYLAVAQNSVDAGFAQITPSIDDASRSLGISGMSLIKRVHAPLLAPSLVTGALLVFVDVMKELPATFALRPFNFDTLAVQAYNFASDERLGEAAIPALLIVAVGLIPTLAAMRATARQGER